MPNYIPKAPLNPDNYRDAGGLVPLFLDYYILSFRYNLQYKQIPYKLNDEDYFAKDEELYYTKTELKNMYNNNEIWSVDRNYRDDEGFRRLK